MNKSLFKKILLASALLSIIPFAIAKEDKMKVVTTFTVIADMARNVAGDAAEVVSITKPGAEIHDYEPTPKDLVKAQDADLVIWNGLNLERWFLKFFDNISDVPSVVITQGIEPMSIYGGEYDGKPNPHAWMSTQNAYTYIDNIRDAFIKYDEKNRDIYTQNAQAYKKEIEEVQKVIESEIRKIPENQRWLVTSEGAFSYLARDMGLQEAYLWPINAEQQGTPKQVSSLINLMREKDIPVIFSESTVSDKPAKQVAKEVGADYGGVLYVDSLSEADGKVPTYLDLLKVTTQTIIDAFNNAQTAE